MGENWSNDILSFQVTVTCDAAWGLLNTCLTMGNGEWMPCFAFLECAAFAFTIKLSLSQPMIFLTFSLLILSPILLECMSGSLLVARPLTLHYWTINNKWKKNAFTLFSLVLWQLLHSHVSSWLSLWRGGGSFWKLSISKPTFVLWQCFQTVTSINW